LGTNSIASSDFLVSYHQNSFIPRSIDEDTIQLQIENYPFGGYGSTAISLPALYSANSAEFRASFNFRILNSYTDPNGGGVGFAFVLQPGGDSFFRGERDGAIGYQNLPSYLSFEVNTLNKFYRVFSRANGNSQNLLFHAPFSFCSNLPQNLKTNEAIKVALSILDKKLSVSIADLVVVAEVDVSSWIFLSSFRVGFTASEAYDASENIFISNLKIGVPVQGISYIRIYFYLLPYFGQLLFSNKYYSQCSK